MSAAGKNNANQTRFQLNGQPAQAISPRIARLSDVLRDELGLTGTKVGCNAGDCGACTVLIDGHQACACLTPLGQADAQLRQLLDAHADRLLGQLNQGHSVLDRARRELARQLPEQGADLELLAHSLQLSARTLQRRLREAGLSFSELLDETRQQLVLHYLRDPALELAEIAFLVGFSEAGSLARAFRRWTGQSPGAYRQSLLDSASQS